jgi:hypothetical protein
MKDETLITHSNHFLAFIVGFSHKLSFDNNVLTDSPFFQTMKTLFNLPETLFCSSFSYAR